MTVILKKIKKFKPILRGRYCGKYFLIIPKVGIFFFLGNIMEKHSNKFNYVIKDKEFEISIKNYIHAAYECEVLSE